MTDPLPQAGAAGTRGAVYPVGADTLVVDNPHFSFPLHVAAH